MAYEAYCAACTYLSEVDNGGKYWDERKGEYRSACDPKCYNFCEAYSRSNYARENMYENSRNHASSSGCYLTTIVCKLLEYPDNNYYLNTLRKFRDEVMRKKPEYISLLLIYDYIGPVIAYELERDMYGQKIASVMFTHYIVPAVGAIEEEKYQTAIRIYKSMINSLAEHYHIDMNINLDDKYDYDYNTLGHGKVRKQKI